MKKKKMIIIIAAVLAFIIAAGGITAYALLPHSLSYDIDSVPSVGSTLSVVSSAEDEVTVKMSGDDFKVLMFTDTHLDGKNETCTPTVENLVNNIVKEKPDLVILGGDNVTSAFNRKRSHQLCEIFENLGVYWAACLGNHEGDNGFSISREDMVELFSSYDHCLMRKGAEDIFGFGNYVLTVLNSDDTVRHAYYFLDTGDEMSSEMKALYGIPEEEDPYDGAKTDQVNWYSAKNAALVKKYGSFKSTVVAHIALPQLKQAAESGNFLYGEKLENVCASGFDSGLFDAMKAGGTTKSFFCGHDHLNSFGVEYEGILLSYIQPSGYSSYTAASKLDYEEKDWLQGYTALQVAKDGTFTSCRVRNSSGIPE